MLYSRVAPSGAVTVMVPVFTLQVGCTTVTVGVTGGVGTVSTWQQLVIRRCYQWCCER